MPHHARGRMIQSDPGLGQKIIHAPIDDDAPILSLPFEVTAPAAVKRTSLHQSTVQYPIKAIQPRDPFLLDSWNTCWVTTKKWACFWAAQLLLLVILEAACRRRLSIGSHPVFAARSRIRCVR